MVLRFDQPQFLWLGLLAIPLVIMGYRAMTLSDTLRRIVILAFRTVLLLALTLVLAGPRTVREHDHLTVIGLLDISGSVQRFGGTDFVIVSLDEPTPKDTDDPDSLAVAHSSVIEHLRQWFRTATNIRTPDDRFGLVVFDGRAIAISAPTKSDYVDDNLDTPIAPGTNIEDAVRLGLAMFPPDTAKRLVLVTDGNETAGNVMEAVRRLGGSDIGVRVVDAGLDDNQSGNQITHRNPTSRIPIDVLPIAYQVTRDVQVVRIEAPPSAQPGQSVTVRIMLESTAPTSGRLTLRREGEPVDLDPNSAGTARHLNIPAGQSVHLAQVTLGETPINRFEAIFEVDDPTHNVLPDNDRAEAFTATPSKGSALVLDGRVRERDNLLAHTLNAAAIPTVVFAPAQLPDDVLSLQNYDLIVLDNVAAYDLSPRQHELLARYVTDLGGGLIMAGGEDSFGAGGWKGSPVAELLPLELDPPREMRLPTAALVLVLDKSGSMNQPVAGARATQQQVANEGAALAIESLRSDNYVGVVTFDMGAHTFIPLQLNEDPKKLANRVRTINAEGGTNLEAALLKSFDMIKDAQVAKKRIVFLTDGRSSSKENLEAIAAQMAAADVQLTTIAVGDKADYEVLERLATVGGGEFYPVRDPRMLPHVLVDSVQVINKPLVKEISFVPRVIATGSTLTIGMDAAPQLGGLIITAPRADPKAIIEMVAAGEEEPLLAHWQVGLGRVAAFTSQIPGSGKWSEQWADWPTAAAFWTQLARITSRPAMNGGGRDTELLATIQDDRLNIAFELAESHPDALAYLQVEGTVYQPDGTGVAVRLRQSGPGRYETSMSASQAGNYIVALNPRRGERSLAPVLGGANRSTNPEFRKYSFNASLLEEIAQQSGGRTLDMNDPLSANLFDRRDMPPSMSSLPAWRNLLWWVLAILLLDVASRRIAWDSTVLRNLFAAALGRVRPRQVRAAEVAATLATLRRVNVEGDQRREAQASGIERLKPTGRIAPPPDREAPINLHADVVASKRTDTEPDIPQPTQPQRTAPDADQVAAALDAFLGRSPSTPKPASPPASSSSTTDKGAGATETTSNLLAAKRRAREQSQRNDDDAPR